MEFAEVWMDSHSVGNPVSDAFANERVTTDATANAIIVARQADVSLKPGGKPRSIVNLSSGKKSAISGKRDG